MPFPVYILEVSQDSPSSFSVPLSCSQKWNGACVTIFKDLFSLLRRVFASVPQKPLIQQCSLLCPLYSALVEAVVILNRVDHEPPAVFSASSLSVAGISRVIRNFGRQKGNSHFALTRMEFYVLNYFSYLCVICFSIFSFSFNYLLILASATVCHLSIQLMGYSMSHFP